MWISGRRWEEMEKRIADLEKKVQDQPLEIFRALCGSYKKEMTKCGHSSSGERKPILRAGADLSALSTDVSKKLN